MKKKNNWIILVVVAVVIIGIIYFSYPSNKGIEYTEFAKCLTDNGVKMYGAYWCPHCADQKEEFGVSFEQVTYVECSLPNRAGQTEECSQAGITAYPTWEFGDGSRVQGSLSFQTLSQKTGCLLP